ncbi:AAA family ATPase [Rhodanobacter sp. C03]|uniref:AAA family ATPase n=1 Tax=Rhodanobacter sp. C03 TaxID=1945858 RepID=UPI0009850F06|nr:AAA family ATPase [Rhodanobacter sp. C03]OOG59934.1 hypothetical protein B0E48_03920 [Rhodanobacter sp. C03]
MIESMRIAGVATYGAANGELNGLSTVNYFFGSNGSGKTTLSNLIGDPTHNDFRACAINWKNQTPLQTLVYNRDFVTKNFSPTVGLKGIFTLGEINVQAVLDIAAEKLKRDDHISKREKFTKTLKGDEEAGTKGKEVERDELNAAFADTCWTTFRKYDPFFKTAFEHYRVRGAATKFRDQVLLQSTSNTADLLSFDDLKEKASTLFESNPQPVATITELSLAGLDLLEANDVLGRAVVGRNDATIAAMINRLQNSDWVKTGRAFFDVNHGDCPFCQQKAPTRLKADLESYFDGAFETDTKAIADLQTSYLLETAKIQTALQDIIDTQSTFIEPERLLSSQRLLSTLIELNKTRLVNKAKEPSLTTRLEAHGPALKEAQEEIVRANVAMARHNQMVRDLGTERATLIAQVWKLLLEEDLKTDLETYKRQVGGLDTAIESLNNKVVALTGDVEASDTAIAELEKANTNTRHAVDRINGNLKSFGFKSFSIKQLDGNKYKLVRADDSEAMHSLSEGERTFVTFLYFIELVRGSEASSGVNTERVVVFDDPVSSLDSDVLFIVSTLIRDVVAEARAGGMIKQVFILTHNVYFHKEVTFTGVKSPDVRTETHWVIRKPDLLSEVNKHATNPIKTSYELLWHEVRDPNRNSTTIQNALRRILENYFKILGGVPLDELIAKFSGRDKSICKALMSWTNDGSHGVEDDVFFTAGEVSVDTYLDVFRMVFEKSENEGHYKMMMGNAYRERAPVIEVAEVGNENATP